MKRLIALALLAVTGLVAQPITTYNLILSRNIRAGGELGPVVMSVAEHFKLRPGKDAAHAFGGALKESLVGRNLADPFVDQLASRIVTAFSAASSPQNNLTGVMALFEQTLIADGTSPEKARQLRDLLLDVCRGPVR